MADAPRPNAVAIVGMAGRFAGSNDLDGFWTTIRDGVEVLDDFSDTDLAAAGVDPELRNHPRYVKRGTVLEGADTFDAAFFGITPREAQILDPQQRIFLECAWEGLEHAGYAGTAAGQAVGVYAGVGMNTYLISQVLRNPAFMASAGGYQLMVGNDKDFLATRVSYKLDLRGPSVTVQTACSTSLVAVVLAARAVLRGECDLALAGGVAALFPQRAGYLFEEGMILSPDGHCRPFDAAGRGIRGSSGAGVVVLKRLSDALKDGDTVHAVILGSAVNNDGSGKAGYTAPSVEGQAEVIATAQAVANVDPRSIAYVEAHGTGTPLGDPIEVAALTQAFRATTSDVGFCRIGSLKANLGHLDAAAGVASLIKTVLVLEHREFPPLVNFRTPNPQLTLETSPFLIETATSPWTAADGMPRRAGVSSFGIGGTNAHVVVEEGPSTAPPAKTEGPHLLVLSAKTAAALEQSTANLAAHLRDDGHRALADVAFTLAVGRGAFPHRRAAVVSDAAHAVEVLSEPARPPVMTAVTEGGTRPVAFLFSGQGSQHVGMGAELYRTERVYRDAIDRAAAVLEPLLGLDIRGVVFATDSDTRVNQTSLTQPALFAVEYALASLWMSWGVMPAAMLGHSIGEYVAAHLAGVLSLEDALAVVAARGRFMQAEPAGSMASVHMSAQELAPKLEPGVEIAAMNAPDLCTVSGSTEAVARFVERLGTSGIDCRPLHTSHAFHSRMMEPAILPFVEALRGKKLNPPLIPYVSNLTGTWITQEEATSPEYYGEHLRRAVRFEDGVRAVSSDPSMLLLEVGPGNALASLARLSLGRNGSKRVVATLPHPRESRSDAATALEAAGRLWLSGVKLDFNAMHADARAHRVPLPTYPFERKRFWVDAVSASAAPHADTADGPRPSDSVDDWIFAVTWTRDETFPKTAGRLAEGWLVLSNGDALEDAVVRQVKARGGVPVVVTARKAFERVEAHRFEVRPGEAEDLARVVREVRGSIAIAGAIHLWSAEAGRLEEVSAANGAALCYLPLVALAEALEPSFGGRPVRIIAATFGAESVLDEPVHSPLGALVTGPVITLPTEVPGLEARAVDVGLLDGKDAISAAAQQLVDEAAVVDGERLAAWRAGRRWVRRFERVHAPPADPAKLPLKSRGVYLVTGGLGGIGLTLSKWLASTCSARLLLTGRTSLPPRETWPQILAGNGVADRVRDAIVAVQEIERAGGEVEVAAAAAEDDVAMRRAIDAGRARFGTIDGVIHAAGIPGTGTVAFRKTPEDVDAVLRPKVGGLSVLQRVFRDAELDFVALFSSINSFLGAPGVADYGAANAVLDAFVESTARPKGWRQVVAIDWGIWRDVGMAHNLVVPEAVRKEREAILRHGITPAGGADAFSRVLAAGLGRVVVTSYDPTVVLRRQRDAVVGRSRAAENAREAPVADAPSTAQARPELSSAYEAPATDGERALASIWQELLGVERIGVHDDFFELGGHSLLATRVLARIDHLLGVRLTLRDVFDAPTIHKLVQRLDEKAAPPSIAPEGDREEIEF
jgi:acyl transferase domain-containing protein